MIWLRRFGYLYFLLWLGSFVFAGTLGFLILFGLRVAYGGGFDVEFGGGWISCLLFGSVALRFGPVQGLWFWAFAWLVYASG